MKTFCDLPSGMAHNTRYSTPTPWLTQISLTRYSTPTPWLTQISLRRGFKIVQLLE
jgi:hypothetical protein